MILVHKQTYLVKFATIFQSTMVLWYYGAMVYTATILNYTAICPLEWLGMLVSVLCCIHM